MHTMRKATVSALLAGTVFLVGAVPFVVGTASASARGSQATAAAPSADSAAVIFKPNGKDTFWE
ncbi:hypothetical protein [Peterkaempfera bronchialis]|uniref:Uncharacterized protein n=1 Tax=Peterkaempfera bronchialis TaxID=2126346 RepID=A0A345SXI7_9ACTN|nr:hypothetical protein [Peterkaempfera bronchialis]AXI78442.1 hypothetical protein C7M71_014375 [Peterkaempfera bronchialis]